MRHRLHKKYFEISAGNNFILKFSENLRLRAKDFKEIF